jgi:hypothetical protein
MPNVNPLRRLLLGSGRLPVQVRALLATEGVVLLDEGLSGSITYRDYHAAGTYSSLRKVAASGAIVVTNERLVVWAAKAKAIDVPLRDPIRAALTVIPTGNPTDGLTFRYNAAAFSPDRRGTVEVHFRTTAAVAVLQLLDAV